MATYDLASVARELALLNPWWDPGPSTIPTLPFRRRLFARLAGWADRPEDSRGALLIGFRRIGKTELAKQWMEHVRARSELPPANVVYADFQEIVLDGVGPRAVVDAVRRIRRVEGPLVVVLDEIQFVEKWDSELRSVLRTESERGSLLLATGSGAADMRRAVGDTLLGRSRVHYLEPMTFAEWLEFARVPADAPVEARRDMFQRYLVRGGFPGLAASDGDNAIREHVREICERYVIDGDLARRLRLRYRSVFGKLWLYLAHNPGVTLDWSKLPGEFGVARETFDEWIRGMVLAELVVELEPSQRGGVPTRGRKRYSKLYAVDHAICGAYGIAPDDGQGLETLVFRHLRSFCERRRTQHGLDTDLTYWRDDKRQGSNEIDFRLHAADFDLLLEVKGARRVLEVEARSLADRAAELDVGRAVFVHNGPNRQLFRLQARNRSITIGAVPVMDFALCMDTCGSAARELVDEEG